MALNKEQAKKILEGGIPFEGDKIELKENDVFVIKEYYPVHDYFALRINEAGDFIFSSNSLTRLIKEYGTDVIGTSLRYTGQTTFKGADGKSRRVNNYEIA